MNKEWEQKTLGDVLDVLRNGVNCKQDKSGPGDKISRIESISNAEFNIDKVGYTILSQSDKEKYRLKKGDILFSHINSPIHVGKTAIFDTGDEVYHGVNLLLMRPRPYLDGKYLEHYLKFIFQKGYWKSVCKQSVNQASVNQQDINKVVITYPKSLSEQQRIVAILDEAFAAIAKAKANAEQNLQNAKELFESYLEEVFVNNGEDWSEKTLGEVANTNGRIGWKGLTAKEYTADGPLFISVHSLNYGDYVDFRDAFHISQKRYDESPEIMLKKDDILICKDGAGIGKIGIVPELPEVATINSSLLLIRCKNVIVSKFLYYNLLSPSFQIIVQSRLNGATTPHLYQRDIVTFPTSLPSLDVQQIIVQKLDTLSTKTKKLEVIYQDKIYDLDELKKSVLQKAFSGELKTSKIGVSV